MAEELAWLVRDNLSCKHLVLSAEEAFVSFLDPDQQRLSNEDVLVLEPMVAYHRMLLHRLADIFRLGHESIGEGSDRRLVLERCEDSRIPDLLVSDVLDCREDGTLHGTPQLLKRATLSDSPNCVQLQAPSLSFEERQAAYLAARERIFSEDMAEPLSKSVMSRPRSVPVVARRMIAHALGKPVLTELNPKNAPSLESAPGHEIDSACHSSQNEGKLLEPILARMSLTTAESGIEDERPKVPENLHAKAAKRMFAHALGFELPKSFCSRYTGMRNTEGTFLPERSISSDVKEASNIRPCEGFTEGQQSSSSRPCTSRSIRKNITGRSCMQQSEKILDEREVFSPRSPAVSDGQMPSSRNSQKERRATERYFYHSGSPSEAFSSLQTTKTMVPASSISSFPSDDGCVKPEQECCVNTSYGTNSILIGDQCFHPLAKAAQIEQGKAAQRMLAQALGFQTFPIGADRNRNV